MNFPSPHEAQWQRSAQESLLHRITTRIRQSLELQQILEATVAEVRAFLKTDRVKIYRFYPDQHGEVIAESIYEYRLPSLLGLNFPADDIPEYARILFQEARQRSIVDLTAQQIGWSPLEYSDTGEPVEPADIRYRPVDPCHVEYLKAMGVQSSVVVPILQNDRLWGLLVSHHATPRQFSESELQFLQLVVDQVSIAIAQSTLLNQVQAQVQRERAANWAATLLHANPKIDFQTALEATVSLLKAVGGRLYFPANSLNQPDECYTCGEQPVLNSAGDLSLERHYLWQRFMQASCSHPSNAGAGVSSPWAVTDLYKEPQFRTLAACFHATAIRGLLILPLQYGPDQVGCLTLFRHAIDTETLWAGQRDSDERQDIPRISFEAWRELKMGQAPVWTDSDLALVEALGRHFVMAIQQYQLHSQIHALNSNLERQVQARTAELQEQLRLAAFRADIDSTLTRSNDLHEMLQRCAEAVVHHLNAAFARIWTLNAAENLLELQASAGLYTHLDGAHARVPVGKFKIGLIAQERLPHLTNDVLSDPRIGDRDWAQREGMVSFAGYPLLMDDQVIGVLAMFSQQPLTEAALEALAFVAQEIALGVKRKQTEETLRQSEAQLRQQTQQLKTTLRELKYTQSQLVQTEKMSSLGQLVAGVAHEINNPVNFIYGNLSHAGGYIQDLLGLIKLYQQYYANPAGEIQAQAEAIDLNFVTEDLPRLLGSMKLGADRIQKIVQALRNFSRMDEAEVKPVSIHDGIDSTLMILQSRLKGSGGQKIKIVKEYADLPLVECYAGQLNQVFMNILSNAIDALEEDETADSPAHPDPTIRIQTEVVDRNVRIRIADNGCGIPEKVRKRLFEPFFTTKAVGKGTGLGLSISYQVVVDKHGGCLTCASTPGQGAEFVIEIPITQVTFEDSQEH